MKRRGTRAGVARSARSAAVPDPRNANGEGRSLRRSDAGTPRGAPRLLQPAPLEQRLDARLAPAELHVEVHRLLRSAARKHHVAEALAVGALEPAVLLEPFERVGVDHLGPQVRVVAGRIA